MLIIVLIALINSQYCFGQSGGLSCSDLTAYENERFMIYSCVQERWAQTTDNRKQSDWAPEQYCCSLYEEKCMERKVVS